jgi:acetolactate synthase-1/2/3 large subunit
MTGAEIVCECLRREGVDLVFGYPGGAILPTYDALARRGDIRHVLTRHEQGASHMADGYARTGGRVGVAVATSGPGATNLVTGIATAMMDSSPLVCITGQVPTSALGSDAFQETDVTGITMPITKHNVLVTDVDELAPALHEAFAIARGGRPGPVLVDICKDVQLAKASAEPSFAAPARPERESALDERGIVAARQLLGSSRRPLILAGNGVLISRATRELEEVAERGGIPVALTLLGKGALPEDHPLCLGMMGMHGEAWVNRAIQRADLLVALGMRFDDRVTGDLATYAPNARKIHVDIDPSEIGKNVAVDVGIVGDLRAVLSQLLPGLETRTDPAWLGEIRAWREESARRDVQGAPSDGRLWAAHAIRDLWEITGGEAITVTDVGQHQMWEAQYYPHRRPRTLITSGGLGTMGFGLPAAIGAKLARPEEEVWAIVGDGGFQMTMAELATAVQERVPIKIALVNNGYLGMVRQWQELFYEQRYYATPLANPDFCKLAEAFGVPAVRVSSRRDVAPAVEWCRTVDDRPSLVELVVEPHDVVYPMVPAGAPLDAMICRPVSEPAPATGGGR